MDGARELLTAERDEARRRLADLTGSFEEVVAASRDTNADDEHDPEGATIAFERSQLATLVAERNEQEALLASMVEGVLAIDDRERVMTLNAAAARLLGVDSSQAVGQPSMSFNQP